MRRKPWATLICRQCQARFHVPLCLAEVAKYCSRRCYGAAHRRASTINQQETA